VSTSSSGRPGMSERYQQQTSLAGVVLECVLEPG
jgi:hypothetical protein